MINSLIFLVLGLVGEATFFFHSREQGRRHDMMVSKLMKQNAALTTALVHAQGQPVASAIIQTFTEDDPTEALRGAKQVEPEGHYLGM